ncbi:MAG: hypothetical protein KAJ40_02940 [Alphaproteobacteria bacterium]|nr:hypothetical protein [Alphaproteobacteria bacterium]
MFSISKSFLTGLAFSTLFVSAFSTFAQAEIFFYEDREERFTMSFPDTWKRVTNQKADDQITISAPGVNDYATCRVRVREDRRFVIYPGKFDSDIQKIAYSRDFWNNYLGEYNDVIVDTFKDQSGLAQGYASMSEASYETAEGPLVRKRGIMFASLYHDQVYVVDCSAAESVFYKWRPAFLSVIKSIEFGEVRHPKLRGNYRIFNNKGEEVKVLGPKELDTYKF